MNTINEDEDEIKIYTPIEYKDDYAFKN